MWPSGQHPWELSLQSRGPEPGRRGCWYEERYRDGAGPGADRSGLWSPLGLPRAEGCSWSAHHWSLKPRKRRKQAPRRPRPPHPSQPSALLRTPTAGETAAAPAHVREVQASRKALGNKTTRTQTRDPDSQSEHPQLRRDAESGSPREKKKRSYLRPSSVWVIRVSACSVGLFSKYKHISLCLILHIFHR